MISSFVLMSFLAEIRGQSPVNPGMYKAGQTYLAPPGTYIATPGQPMVPLTEQNMPPALRRQLAKEQAEQEAYDQTHSWVNRLRKPLFADGKISTQAEAVAYIKHIDFFLNLGATGNPIAMEKAVWEYERAASYCMRVVRENFSRTRSVSYWDYRQVFILYGKAAAIRDIINEVGAFRSARLFANKRMQFVNNSYASHLNTRKPGNLTNQDLKTWVAEGYQEALADWNSR